MEGGVRIARFHRSAFGPVSALLLAALVLGGCAPVQHALFEAGLRAERRASDMGPAAVETALGEIAYLEREGDGEAVVLLHGFAGNKDYWLRFARHLPDSLRVVAFDLPGHGESTFDSTRTYDVPALTAGIAEATEALGLGRFHLAGNSLGGLVATRLALDHPERVTTLFLLDPAGVVPPARPELDSGTGPLREALAGGRNPLVPTTTAGYDSLTALAFNDPPDLPWPAEAVIAREYAARAPQNRKIWRDINRPPEIVTDELPDLAVPVLLLFGADDRVIDPSSAEIWAERVPQIEVVLLPGVGHAPMLEVPRTTARFFSDFLRRAAR